MTGLGTLIAVRFRRDRWQLVIWLASIALLAVFSGAAILKTYGTLAQRQVVLGFAGSDPTILVVRGTPQGASLGAFFFFEVGTFLAVLFAFMSTFMAVRQGRAEEDAGTTELVRAARVSRFAPPTATIVEGVVANVVVGAVVALLCASIGLPMRGSLIMGASLALCGVVFVTIGILMGQLAPSSRAANGLASSLIGLAYLARGIGDASGSTNPATLVGTAGAASWASPIGWAQRTNPYSAATLWPLVVSAGAAVVVFAVSLMLERQRDLGASLLHERRGRAWASKALTGPVALAFRLQRASIIAWASSAALMGLLVASLMTAGIDAIEKTAGLSNAIASIVGGHGTITDYFITAIMSFVGVLAAACGSQVMMRARQEEASGHLELIRSTRVSAMRWVASYLVVAVSSVMIVLAAAVVFAGMQFLAQGQSWRVVGLAALGAIAQLPVSLFFVGLTGALFAVLPRLSIPIAWIVLAGGLFIGQFGGMMGLARWARSISPFAHTPAIPGSSVDWSGTVWLLGLALVLAVVTVAWVGRRDLKHD